MTTSIAYVFPGQGSERGGMGLALAARTGRTSLLVRAGELCGVDLPRAIQRGERALARTEVIQPALTAVCLIVVAALADAGVSPSLVAGHSVGEIAALSASGRIDAEEAIALAALRGRLMAREASLHPGGMAAIDRREPEPADLVLAAHNAPDEWVFSGPIDAIDRFVAERSARRLAVAGAWHSPAMAGAVEELRAAVKPHGQGRARFVCNRTGGVADDASLPDLLAEQLTHPVQWARTMQTLVESGVTDIVTIGPAKVLRALVRRNLGERVRVHTTEELDDLERTCAYFAGVAPD